MPFGQRDAAAMEAEIAALVASAHTANERGRFADALAMAGDALRKGAKTPAVWEEYTSRSWGGDAMRMRWWPAARGWRWRRPIAACCGGC